MRRKTRRGKERKIVARNLIRQVTSWKAQDRLGIATEFSIGDMVTFAMRRKAPSVEPRDRGRSSHDRRYKDGRGRIKRSAFVARTSL